ncbi:MAG TPA: hypothetical protein VMI12_01720 [Puia sp.]|nr:hypothetical protein [Puia sp.]
MKSIWIKPLTMSVIGLALLLPASFFLFSLAARIFFGYRGMYYSIAPSFLEASSEIISFQKSAWILYGPLLAILLNVLAIFQFRLVRHSDKIKLIIFYRRFFLNAAVVLQSILFLIMVLTYLIIEHYRY